MDPENAHRRQGRKSRYQLILLSMAVCGVELVYAAELAFVTPTFRQGGIPHIFVSMVWTTSPLLGLLFAPFMGSCSDQCTSWLGRRRPFILFFGSIILAGLLLVPHGAGIAEFLLPRGANAPLPTPTSAGNNVTAYNDAIFENVTSVYTLPGVNESALWGPDGAIGGVTGGTSDVILWNGARLVQGTWAYTVGIVLSMAGVVCIDFAADSCQNPCRAFLLDVTVAADHQAGLTMFTLVSGAGGALGYTLGAIDWSISPISRALGGQIGVVFLIVTVLFVSGIVITVFSNRETPLNELRANVILENIHKPKYAHIFKKLSAEPDPVPLVPDDGNTEPMTLYQDYSVPADPTDPPDADTGAILPDDSPHPVDRDTLLRLARYLDENPKEYKAEFASLQSYIVSIIKMPWSMKLLCLCNFFGWFSMLCYSLYFTDFVAEVIYDYHPGDDCYMTGVRRGCIGMIVWTASSCLYSACLEKLISRFGLKTMNIFAMLVYAVGTLSIAVFKNIYVAMVASVTAGIMYTTLFAMPFILLSSYYEAGMFETLVKSDTCRTRGIGTDISVVSSMMFVSQLILSLVGGNIISAVGSVSVIFYMACGSSVLAAVVAHLLLY